MSCLSSLGRVVSGGAWSEQTELGSAKVLESNVATGAERVLKDDKNEAAVDAALVTRAVEGDLPAFRQLVERYQRRILSVALGIMGNRDDAEDVVQESFLKAFRNLHSFRRESSFYTWLYRIVYNLAIDEKRKRYRHVENSIGDEKILEASAELATHRAGSVIRPPDADLERSQLQSQLKVALESLSAEHRTVILLREVDGLSYSEISEAVGCSKGTVMSRLHHARKKLQRYLKKSAPEATENLREGEVVEGGAMKDYVGGVRQQMSKG